MLSEGTNAKFDARKIQSLARAQFTPDRNSTMDLVASHTFHLQLHHSIVEKESIASLYYARQDLKTHGRSMVITYDVFTGERKLVAHSQLYRLRVDFAQPHFWPRQIGHNRDHSAHFLGNRPDASDDLAMM